MRSPKITRRTILLFILMLCSGSGLYVHFNSSASVPDEPPRIPYQAPRPPIDVELPPLPNHPPVLDSAFHKNLAAAVNPLYADTGSGLRFICTTTAIQKTETGYILLTAQHCVSGSKDLFVVFDMKADQPYTRATVALAGSADTDAALLSVHTDRDIPVIPIGDNKLLSEGSDVEYIGFPMNLGKLYFRGYVSSKEIGPPAYTTPQWKGDIGLTIQVAGGSSGSALIDPSQQAIVGVVTGMTIRSNVGGVVLTMATPSTKVRALIDDYKHGRVAKPAVEPENLLKRFF